jgi:hypothetical protein
MKYDELCELIGNVRSMMEKIADDSELHIILQKVDTALVDLKDCKNELCWRCGEYKQRHNGACNWCRWKE